MLVCMHMCIRESGYKYACTGEEYKYSSTGVLYDVLK